MSTSSSYLSQRTLRIVKDRGLRRLLRMDYRELRVAREHQMGVATLVLSGAIVEAVLVDFLKAIGYTGKKKPENMFLVDLIAACEDEGALTPETRTLSTALQGYRNLIHPGRIMREDEWPTDSRAEAAAAVVDRVLADVGERMTKRPEWAAEVLVETADEYYHASREPLRRGIRGLPVVDAERMVLELVPERLRDEDLLGTEKNSMGYGAPVDCYRTCLDEALKHVSAATMKAAAEALLGELEDPDPLKDNEIWVETLYFPALLEALCPDERNSMASEVVWTLRPLLERKVCLDLSGIGGALTQASVKPFVESLARASVGDDERVRQYARMTLRTEGASMSDESRLLAARTLDGLVAACEAAGGATAASDLMKLRYEIAPLRDEDILS